MAATSSTAATSRELIVSVDDGIRAALPTFAGKARGGRRAARDGLDNRAGDPVPVLHRRRRVLPHTAGNRPETVPDCATPPASPTIGVSP
jgi:hypothetical protein